MTGGASTRSYIPVCQTTLLSASVEQSGDLLTRPNVIAETCSHRRGGVLAERLMWSAEGVVDEEKGDGARQSAGKCRPPGFYPPRSASGPAMPLPKSPAEPGASGTSLTGSLTDCPQQAVTDRYGDLPRRAISRSERH